MIRLIRTELLKHRTTRTFAAGLLAVPVLSPLMATAVLFGSGRQGNDPLGAHSFLQTLGAPAGMVTTVALLLGMVAAAGEFRHGTVTTTFLACPRRRDVVRSKLGASALAGAAMGAVSLVMSAAVALPWLWRSGIEVHAGTEAAALAAGLVVETALYFALGTSMGLLLRNQAAAVAVALTWLLAIESLLGDVFARSAFVDWLPAAAGRAMVHVGPVPEGPGPALAAAVFGGHVAALAIAATALTLHRDIT
jgi:ABC-2 type transport system permease protein